MNFKLRIKHPSGAEFEAEGPAEFIQAEKEGFLDRLIGAQPSGQQKHHEEQNQETVWGALTEAKNGALILKNKHQNLKSGDAALLILAAERQINAAGSVSAITLAKAIRASGYAPGRVDRLLAKPHREGLIKASGTKRNRAYQITDKGLERAWLEARKIGQ